MPCRTRRKTHWVSGETVHQIVEELHFGIVCLVDFSSKHLQVGRTRTQTRRTRLLRMRHIKPKIGDKQIELEP